MARSALAFVVVPVLVGGGAVAQPIAAEPAPAAAVAPPVEDDPAPAAPPRWFERVTIGALVDGYVAAPLTGEVDAPSRLRVFDAANATFALAYAELALALPADFAAVVKAAQA